MGWKCSWSPGFLMHGLIHFMLHAVISCTPQAHHVHNNKIIPPIAKTTEKCCFYLDYACAKDSYPKMMVTVETIDYSH